MSNPNPCVLVVDDSPTVQQQLAAELQTLGFRVITTDCAETGLELLINHSFDLALVDYQLPGHDGLWLIEQARAKLYTLPCMLLTVHRNVEVAVTATQLGAPYVLKPLKEGELWIAIQQAHAFQKLYQQRVEAAAG